MTSIEQDLDPVPASSPASQVQRLMQISVEVHQKLQCLISPAPNLLLLAIPILQGPCHIPNSSKQVVPRAIYPSSFPRESTGLAGVIVFTFDIVQRGCPPVLRQVTYAVCPCCYGRQVALRLVRVHRSKVEDGAKFRQDSWVQMNLGDRCYYFVALRRVSAFVTHIWRKRSPAAPHALTEGIRPVLATAASRGTRLFTRIV
jgi:hypothetical protein